MHVRFALAVGLLCLLPLGGAQARTVYECLRDQYEFTPRGGIEIKGRGQQTVFLLKGRRADTAPAPAEPVSV